MQTFLQRSTGRENLAVKYGPDHVCTLASNGCISRLRFSPVYCPVQLLGATSWDTSCCVWEVQTNPSTGEVASIPSFTTTHDAPLLDVSFSGDGRAFFCGCSNNAVMWNLQQNTKSIVAGHDLPISCLAFIPAAEVGLDLLVTGSWDGRVRWWDLRSPNPIKEENFGEPVFSMDAQKSFPMMAVGTGRTVHLFDMKTMSKVQEMAPPPMMKFALRTIACSPALDGVAMGSTEGRVSYVPLNTTSTEKPRTYKSHMVALTGTQTYVAHQTNMVVHHPHFPIVFSGGGDGNIAVIKRAGTSDQNALTSSGIDCKVMHETLPVPIAAGDLHASGNLLAYAHSYDWALGKAGFRNQPVSIHIRSLMVEERKK